MSLSASMWTGVSGLLAHGEKMNVIGNNIANINTVGFKGQRMDFADLVYQNNYINAGLAQVGRGVKIGAIASNFTTGSFESTTGATDLAIDGSGFFKVNKIGTKESFYTRAGNFNFNVNGYLTDPNGLALQGWRIDNDNRVSQANRSVIATQRQSAILGTGVTQDIQLDAWSVPPQQTTNVAFSVNLPQGATDNKRSDTNPFASLFEAWNGSSDYLATSTKPITGVDYMSTIEVYDEAGVTHTLTVYFDLVESTDHNGNNVQIWEYIVTMDPSEDQRMFMDTSTNPPALRKVNDTEAGGLLMSGTLTFTAGQLVNQSAYVWGGSQSPDTDPNNFTTMADPNDPLNMIEVINLDPSDMNNWYPAAVSTSGLPIMVANFTGVLDAQTSGSTNGPKYNIELDFGLSAGNTYSPWQNSSSLASLSVEPYVLNTGYKANDPNTHPQYILLNTDYDPDSGGTIWTNPNLSKYKFDIPGLYDIAFPVDYVSGTGPGTGYVDANGVSLTAAEVTVYEKYLDDLRSMYAAKEFTFEAGYFDDTVSPTVPPNDITLALGNYTDPTTGEPVIINYNSSFAIQLADGTWQPTGFTTQAEMDAFIAEVEKMMEAKASNGVIKDYTVLAEGTPPDLNLLATFSKPVVIDASAFTSYEGSFAGGMSQNGYGYGDLSSWTVDSQGILYGTYSNGVTLPLWQICLYDFNCQQGLRREGNNLFSQTRESGEAKWGAAGTNGMGTINNYMLEQSNVDMSTEFVYMISTQRGFQANSKIITTTDTMLETVVNMKR